MAGTETAPANTKQQDELESTPYDLGTAAYAPSITDFSRRNFSGLVAKDLKPLVTVDIHKLLDYLLSRILVEPQAQQPKVADLVQTINKAMPSTLSSKLQSLHREYIKSENEKDSYAPWIELTNTALNFLRRVQLANARPSNNEIDLISQRNDPNILEYFHNTTNVSRKPDTILIAMQTARRLRDPTNKYSWSDISKLTDPLGGEKDEKKKLDWVDVLLYCEHKGIKPNSPTLSGLPRGGVTRRSGSIPASEPQMSTTGSSQSASLRPVQAGNIGLGILTRTESQTKADTPEATAGQRSSARLEANRQLVPFPSYSLSKPSDPPLASSSNEGQDPTSNVFNQAGEYAISRLSASPAMTHAMSLVMNGRSLSVHWYDRQGVISTKTIDFGTQNGLEVYLSLLFILQRFQGPDWGIHPIFTSFPFHPNSKNPAKGITLTVGNKKFRLEGKVRHKQWGIKGRSTSVVNCMEIDEDGHDKRECVIKISFPQESRRREHEFLDRAYKIAKQNPQIRDHIPKYVAYEEYPETSTGLIRHALNLDTIRTRSMYAIVLIRLEAPINQLFGVEYWRAWWDCFICHRVLWINGMHHRDISDTNLMFKRESTSGVVGVLSDFDLASFEGDMGKNTERTGTLPFMACDLLTLEGLNGQLRHTYEHDAESFFWVAVINTALYPREANRDQINDIILSWATGGMPAILLGLSKNGWLLSNFKHIVTKEQMICWDGGFSQLITLWLRQRFSVQLSLGSVRTVAQLYEDHILIEEAHEGKHPELKKQLE